MRFGVCAPLEKVDLLAAVGYDYIELGVQSALIPEASEEEFREIRDRASNAPLRPGAFAGFIPGDLRVVGDSLDFPRLSPLRRNRLSPRKRDWRRGYRLRQQRLAQCRRRRFVRPGVGSDCGFFEHGSRPRGGARHHNRH